MQATFSMQDFYLQVFLQGGITTFALVKDLCSTTGFCNSQLILGQGELDGSIDLPRQHKDRILVSMS